MSREVCGVCWCPYDEETGACGCEPASKGQHMTTLRTAAQQALEALEQDNPSGRTATITALKAALRDRLAQPEQEPVAWANEIIDDLHALHDSEMIREIDSGDALIRLDAAIAAVEEAEQRYTSPPQPLNLNDPAVQKRLVAQWGYVKVSDAAEPAGVPVGGHLAASTLVTPRGSMGEEV